MEKKHRSINKQFHKIKHFVVMNYGTFQRNKILVLKISQTWIVKK